MTKPALIGFILAASLHAQPPAALVVQSPAPASPVVSTAVIGNSGQQRYSYWVIANYAAGAAISLQSDASQVPNTLTGGNYVNIGWAALPGVTSYDVLRFAYPSQFNGISCIGCAVATGVTGTNQRDTSNSGLGNYTISGSTAVANGSIYLNNRDYSPAQWRKVTDGVDTGLTGTGTVISGSTGVVQVTSGVAAAIANFRWADNTLTFDGTNPTWQQGGAITGNPYGVTPRFVNSAGPSVWAATRNCFGLGTLNGETACYPTPGRILTVSGTITASSVDGYAIGLDIHPVLTATAANQTLVGKWIDPQLANSGASGYNCGAFAGCKTAGQVVNASSEQIGYHFHPGYFVGLQNGSGAARPTTTTTIATFGDADGTYVANESYDIGSGVNGASLVGVDFRALFSNTGAGATTLAGVYHLDSKPKITSTNANTVTQFVHFHFQDVTKDTNTTITDQIAVLFENFTVGTRAWSFYDKAPNRLFAQTSFEAATTDFAYGTTGSALRTNPLASTGNTSFVSQTVQSGNTAAAGNQYIQPFGGKVVVGNSTTDTGSTVKLELAGPGIQLIGGTQPTCSATERGTINIVGATHSAGVKDSAVICMADGADAYAWRTIY